MGRLRSRHTDKSVGHLMPHRIKEKENKKEMSIQDFLIILGLGLIPVATMGAVELLKRFLKNIRKKG